MSRLWFLTRDLGEIQGVKLEILKWNRLKVTVWIPGIPEDLPRDVMKTIRVQNRKKTALRLPEWTLIARESLPLGERLVLGAPEEAFTGVDYVWLNFQLTQVQARAIRKMSTTQEGSSSGACTCKCTCGAKPQATPTDPPRAPSKPSTITRQAPVDQEQTTTLEQMETSTVSEPEHTSTVSTGYKHTPIQ
ncbi:hypothetical protein O0L34_g6669 [Tuta absoluta]|nr:hypothetical protein O0L34_g6669 [Tuta absoluta]